MSDQNEDLLLSHDEDQPTSVLWSPLSLLTAEAASITAFSIALGSMLGLGSSMLVAQSVLGTPIGPSDLRIQNLIAAAITLAMALGAILLASRVLRQAEAQYAQWAQHLARAAVAVGAIGALLSAAALIGALLSHTPVGGQVYFSSLSNSAATYGTGG
jgi:hypothetical protein